MIKQYPLSFMILLLNLYAIRRVRNACLAYVVTVHDISWWQWANDQNGKAEKQEFKGSLMDCFDILKQQSSYFLFQSRAFISERESLKDDDSTVVIQVDFAENYTTQIQNAIQSSDWVSKQFTLFTVCAWEKNGCHSIVIASDCLSHNKYVVLAFMSMLVDHLKYIREFNRYVAFSDGVQLSSNKNSLCVERHCFSSLSVGISLPQVMGKGQQMELEVELSMMYITQL